MYSFRRSAVASNSNGSGPYEEPLAGTIDPPRSVYDIPTNNEDMYDDTVDTAVPQSMDPSAVNIELRTVRPASSSV